MTIEELQQENQKLNARLQKAVTVFSEQKAQIERLTAERDAALAKTEEANKQDQLFFELQGEVDQLKELVKTKTKEGEEKINQLESDIKEKDAEIGKLNTRLEKAAKSYDEQKETISLFQKQNEGLANCLRAVQDACLEGLKKMQ